MKYIRPAYSLLFYPLPVSAKPEKVLESGPETRESDESRARQHGTRVRGPQDAEVVSEYAR